MRRPTFNPKEALAAIARRITVVTALSGGLQLENAEFLGSVSEGVVKGFELKDKSETILSKLLNTIDNALNQVFLSNEYEISDGCKENLRHEIFAVQNAVQYLQSDDPVGLFEETIIKICTQSEECDVESLPIRAMAVSISCYVNDAIRNNHDLSGLATFLNTEEILKLLNMIFAIVSSNAMCEPDDVKYSNAEIWNKAQVTAEKFATLFDEPLFAEHEFIEPILLSDVYVDSGFLSSSGDEYDNFCNLYQKHKNDLRLLIEGAPGIGKSSLVMNIAVQYLTSKIFEDQNVFFIRGKEIRYSNGNPVEDILKIIGVQKISMLEGSVVILDAYDEISYASESVERNQEYLSRLLRAFNGISLIITVRSDYIKQFAGDTVEMLGFAPEKRELFLKKYNLKLPGSKKMPDEFIFGLTKEDDEYSDGIYEILSIPMLLYMIAVHLVNIEKIEDKYHLYQVVFAPGGKGALHSRGEDKKDISRQIWSETYLLTLQIAKSMYFKNDLYISESDILAQINDMEISADSKITLKNRFGVEIFLKGEEKGIFTFAHKSIYEHFAAKWICGQLRTIIVRYLHENQSLEQVILSLNKTFNATRFDQNVFEYIMHNVNDEYFTSVFRNSDLLYKTAELLNALLQVCICEDNGGGVPYYVQMKNMLLWVFNSFSIIFGMFEIEGTAHWVKITHEAIRFLLKLKNTEDHLFISHMDLKYISLENIDFGETYFINNDLTGASFLSATCDKISSSGQSFRGMIMKSADFYNNVLEEVVFDGSDLRFADFRNASLINASFRGADLRCAFFSGAELYEADFTGAHIFLEDFENADYDEDAFKGAVIHEVSEDPNVDILHFDSMDRFVDLGFESMAPTVHKVL